ncbi:hypothetical protein [Gordonia spumicola]
MRRSARDGAPRGRPRPVARIAQALGEIGGPAAVELLENACR